MTTISTGSGACAVSVVVSTHNRSRDLHDALEALMHQDTGVPYELVIVDNNSTDDTRDVVQRAIPASPVPLIYLFEPRQGVSYGRNAGILEARAPIIAFTDDDCRPAADWVHSIVRAFAQHPNIDCIGGRAVPRWPERVPAWFTPLQASPLALCEHGDKEFPVDVENAATCLLTANLACRRSAFDRAGLFSPDYPRGQDREIQLRMWRAGCRGMYVPTVVVAVPIPAERLTKPYFRAWYRKYGAVHARLELLERINREGRLVEPAAALRLFGTAPHIYREFGSAALKWIAAAVRRREVDSFFYENRFRYFWNYIATSYRRHRTTSETSFATEVTRFLCRRLRKNGDTPAPAPPRRSLAQMSPGDVSDSACQAPRRRPHGRAKITTSP
jgi:glycosyltransferase involved in cell wall biosynthesis